MLGKRAKFDSHYCCLVEPYKTSFACLVMAADAWKKATFLLLVMLLCFIMLSILLGFFCFMMLPTVSKNTCSELGMLIVVVINRFL